MDLSLLKVFSDYGLVGGGFIIMILSMVYYQKRYFNVMIELMENNTKALNRMSCNIGKTLLSAEQAVTIFELVLNDHINRKIDFVEDILRVNNIKKRSQQIKDNIKSKFVEITQKEATILSGYNTPAGDMGTMLLEFDLNSFLDNTYTYVFSDDTVENKLIDLRLYMNNCVNDLVKNINERIKENS